MGGMGVHRLCGFVGLWFVVIGCTEGAVNDANDGSVQTDGSHDLQRADANDVLMTADASKDAQADAETDTDAETDGGRPDAAEDQLDRDEPRADTGSDRSRDTGGAVWMEDFEGGDDASLWYTLSGFPGVEGTADEGVPDCMETRVDGTRPFRGSRSNSYRMTMFPCLDGSGNAIDNASHRYYPLYRNRNVALPALVTFWFYEDAGSWPDAYGTRFSPLSLKDQSAPGPADCDPRSDPDGCIPIITTQILRDGTMRCGHCTVTSRSTSLRVPLRQWVLMSIFVDRDSSLTIWIDGDVAVEGQSNLPFRVLERWHMGFYGEGNGLQSMYNDDMKVFEVSDYAEAEALVRSELR